MGELKLSYPEYRRLRLTEGGDGSGNFDHDGRPGQVGGSAPDNSPKSIFVTDEEPYSRFVVSEPSTEKRSLQEWAKRFPNIKSMLSDLSSKPAYANGLTNEAAITIEMTGWPAIKAYPLSGQEIEKPVDNIIQNVERKIVGLPHEEAFLIDEYGRILHHAKGEQDEVDLGREWDKELKNRIVTHNHPDNSAISPPDVFNAINSDLRQIRAVSDKYVHQVTRPKNGWPNEIIEKMEAMWWEEFDLSERLLKQYMSKSTPLSERQIAQMLSHVPWMIIAAKLKIPYRRRLQIGGM